MLSIGDRRSFLRVGTLGLGGLTLSNLLAAAETKRLVKDKSVIFLFLHGGPTQTETFDPKMTAPDGVRSVTGQIPTKLPGVTFEGPDAADALAIAICHAHHLQSAHRANAAQLGRGAFEITAGQAQIRRAAQ